MTDTITLQLQKEKKEKTKGGHQKLLKEDELQLEEVKAKPGENTRWYLLERKYNQISSIEARTFIILERKTEDKIVDREAKPAKVELYQHPHYHESLQRRQK